MKSVQEGVDMLMQRKSNEITQNFNLKTFDRTTHNDGYHLAPR